MSGSDLGKILGRIYPSLTHLAYAKNPSRANNFGAALKELQRGLTGERRLPGEKYFSRADFLGAYLLYYWPVSFIQVSLALSEVEARVLLPPHPTVLDLGAGPGPASFAALARGAESCLLLDASASALDSASRLAGELSAGRPDAPSISTRVFDLEGAAPLPQGPFDLIVACHSVNELWKERPEALERRAELLERAAAELSPGGILLVVEPSAAVTSIPALELRDRLIRSGGDTSKTGLVCVAPCPKSLPCPALGAGSGRPCHSTWKWDPPDEIAVLAGEAGFDRDSAKATWFALAKTGAMKDAGPADSDALTSSQAPERRTGAPGTLSGRVISEPLLNKARRIRFIVCAGDGLATISAPSGESSTAPKAFLGLRRGDCFSAENLSPRPGERSFGFEPESRIVVEFRAPEVT